MSKFYACYYILGTRQKHRYTHSYLRWLCYFTCDWSAGAETSLLLTAYRTMKSPYLIHAADGYYTFDSSCITLLLIHHNHKVFVSYHKKGVSLICWQMVHLKKTFFVVRIVWRKYLTINSLLASVSGWHSSIVPFRLF